MEDSNNSDVVKTEMLRKKATVAVSDFSGLRQEEAAASEPGRRVNSQGQSVRRTGKKKDGGSAPFGVETVFLLERLTNSGTRSDPDDLGSWLLLWWRF
jgi:hypothetical protein